MGLFNNNNQDKRKTNPGTTPAMPAMNQRNIVIIGLVVLAAVFLLPRLFNNDNGGNNNNNVPNNQTRDTESNINIGDVVVSPNITNAGCASDPTGTFDANDRIYLVAENATVPAGTTVFGRLYYDGEVVTDADEITASNALNNGCFNIWFEDVNGFDPGEYEAQFFINGNAADTVTFEVR